VKKIDAPPLLRLLLLLVVVVATAPVPGKKREGDGVTLLLLLLALRRAIGAVVSRTFGPSYLSLLPLIHG